MCEDLFVLVDGVKRQTRLVHDRQRSRILRLVDDGTFVKVVKDSCQVLEDPKVDTVTGIWLVRNRRSWRHLRVQTHSGLLRVGERVVDNVGDEGYLCQALDVVELDAEDHPARKTLGDFLRCAIHLARAVGVMHRAGFVHADITPSNVCFLHGLPVLIDYEMTVRIGQYPSLFETSDSYATVCCTPACCSPEQTVRACVTPASDVFCLGLTLLSWVTEHFGVWGTYFHQTKEQSMHLCARGEYAHWEIAEQRLQDDRLITILSTCLQMVPCDRWTDADQLADQLEQRLSQLMPHELSRPLTTQRMVHIPSDNHTICLELA